MKTFELLCVLEGRSALAPDVHTQCVQVGAFSAILSSAPRKILSLPISRRDALQQAAERQALFEAMMSVGTVLVAKPQQWLTLEQADVFLRANAEMLVKLAAKLRDKAQFQVSVTWDASKVLGHFREAPELSDLFEAPAASASLIAGSVGRLRSRLSAQIRDLIDPVAPEVIALPKDDNMLCNLVVLIAAVAEPDLDTCVAQIDAIWPDGLMIRQIGPAAAGSFALLDLDWIDTGGIAAAHAMLSLKVGGCAAEREAARRAALMSAPSEAAQIRRAADIVAAAIPGAQGGLHIARIVSEGQGRGETHMTAAA